MTVLNIEPELDWWVELTKKYGVKPEFHFPMYLDVKRHFRPPVIRTETEVLQDIHAHMMEAIKILEDGMIVDTAGLMKEHGLDPANRSDAGKTRAFLKESGLLQYKGPSPEQWVRRITNGSGSTKTPDAAD